MRRFVGALTLGFLLSTVTGSGQEENPPLEPTAAGEAVAEVGVLAATLSPDRPVPDVITVRDKSVLEPDEPAKTDVTLDLKTRVGLGVGFLGPLGAAGRVSLLHGLGADVRDEDVSVKAVCAVPIPHCAKGFLIQADAGTGGGKLSIGVGAYARIHEESFKGAAGAAFRLAVARTWGDPIGTKPGLTYLGPELDLSVYRVNLTLGVLFRIAGEGGSTALFSWGVGFGG
jgi:hypothetical protein